MLSNRGTTGDVLNLLQRGTTRDRRMHVEVLQEINGEAAYSRAQGEG